MTIKKTESTTPAVAGSEQAGSAGTFDALTIPVIPMKITQGSVQAADAMPFNILGGIFRITTYNFTESDEKGVIHINFTNSSDNWVAIEIVRANGDSDHTPRIARYNYDEPCLYEQGVTQFLNAQCRIFRWKPGFLGIPGSGGGEIQFTLPVNVGSAVLDIEVVG